MHLSWCYVYDQDYDHFSVLNYGFAVPTQNAAHMTQVASASIMSADATPAISLTLPEMYARWHKLVFTMFPMQSDCLCCWISITILQQAQVGPRTLQLNDLEDMLTTCCHVTGPGSSTSKEAVQLCHPDPK